MSPGLIECLGFKRGQGFVVYVPFLEDDKNCLRAKPCTHEPTEDAGGLFLVLGFQKALAAKVIAGQLFFTHIFVGQSHRFFDDFWVDAFDLEVGNHAPAAELFVIAAKGRVGGGVFRVVQVSAILQSNDNQLHQRLADFGVGLDTVTQQAFQFRNRAHATSQRAYGVFVEFVFGEEFSGTAKCHSYTIARTRTAGNRPELLGRDGLAAAPACAGYAPWADASRAGRGRRGKPRLYFRVRVSPDTTAFHRTQVPAYMDR